MSFDSEWVRDEENRLKTLLEDADDFEAEELEGDDDE